MSMMKRCRHFYVELYNELCEKYYCGSKRPVVSVMLLMPLGNKIFFLSAAMSLIPSVPIVPFLMPFVVPLVLLVCGTSRVRESTSKRASILATERASNNGKRA